jgi:hypothetical protein
MILPKVKTLYDIYKYYKNDFVIIAYDDTICSKIYDFMIGDFAIRVYLRNITYFLR